MIFYVHGFNSGAGSSSGKLLERQIGAKVHRLEYSSDGLFADNFESLKQQVNRHADGFDVLVGNNLQARKDYIVEHGSEYIDRLDVS